MRYAGKLWFFGDVSYAIGGKRSGATEIKNVVLINAPPIVVSAIGRGVVEGDAIV